MHKNPPDLERAELVEVFGRRVKARRNDLGLTQVQLGERLEEKQGRISAIENGRNGVGAHRFAAFAEALQVEVAWLLGYGSDDYNEYEQERAASPQQTGDAA